MVPRSVLVVHAIYLFFFGLLFSDANDKALNGLQKDASATDIRNQAAKLNGAGELEGAIELLEDGTQKYPKDQDLALDLAINYAFARRYQEALPAYRRALDLLERRNGKPSDIARALTWIGVCLRRLGQKEEAILWLEKGRERYPQNAENLYHLCYSYQADGRIVEGGRVLAEAMKLESKDMYLDMLSGILSALGFWDVLTTSWHACLEDGLCRLDENSYMFHLRYAMSLKEVGSMEKAHQHFKNAAELSGKDISDIEKLANSYYSQAERTRRASKDIPQDEESLGRLHDEFRSLFASLFSKTKLAAWSLIEERHVLTFQWPIPEDLINQAHATLEEQKEAFHDLGGAKDVVSPFTCLTLPVFTLNDCNFAATVKSKNLQTFLRENNIAMMDYNSFEKEGFGQPLRIGLFSADVRGHPMMSLLNAFFKHTHPMADVHVILYHVNSDPEYLKQLKPFVDETKECLKTHWIMCVEHARKNRVQVWLEATGYTGEGIPAIAAAGPAPVGVVWAGFPGSIGMSSTVQYIVSDRYTVPVDSAIRRSYHEHILYVPGSWMIADPIALEEMKSVSNATRQGIRNNYGIPTDAFVYGYFGRFWKVDDKLFHRWCEIVESVPNSYLVVLVTHYRQDIDPKFMKKNIRKAWSEHGLSPDRLKILAPFMRGEHIRALSRICDVALDTAMYGGGTTSYEALYAGLPLVHAAGGEKMMQRAGGSILSAAGLDDLLIAKNFDEYVHIAVRLGSDADYYKQVKEHVDDSASRRNGSLFHPETRIRGLVDGLRHAYHLWLVGETPQDIFADEAYAQLHRSKHREGATSTTGILHGEL